MNKTLLFLLSFSILCSCKKMAMRHTCVCEIKLVRSGYEEVIAATSKEQLGTYERAKDSCDRLQESSTYTINTPSGEEQHIASCEID